MSMDAEFIGTALKLANLMEVFARAALAGTVLVPA